MHTLAPVDTPLPGSRPVCHRFRDVSQGNPDQLRVTNEARKLPSCSEMSKLLPLP